MKKSISRKNILKNAGVMLLSTTLIFSGVAVMANTNYNNSGAVISLASASHLAAEKNSLPPATMNLLAIVLEIKDVKGGFEKISAILNNIVVEESTNVDWRISVKGGILGFINVETTGNIILTPASSNGSETIQTDKTIFGLGKVDITLNATYAHSWVGTAFVLGPFVLAINQTQFTVPEVKVEKIGKTNEDWTVTVQGNDYAVGIKAIKWTHHGTIFTSKFYTEPLPGCGAQGEWSDTFTLTMTPDDFHIIYKTKLKGQLKDVQNTGGTNEPRTQTFGPPMPEGWQPLPPTQ